MRGFYHSLTQVTLGVGVGLRAPHVTQILQQQPRLDWFELLADNHMVEGGWARRQVIEIANLYPVTMHCVGMSIGSVEPINFDYLKKVKSLADEIKPKLISDHLCWTHWRQHQSHDLLPLPYTEEALLHVVDRIEKIQDYLGTRIAIENVSSYATYRHSNIEEVEFVNAVAQQADSYILFDINNLYVNHINNDLNPIEYLNAIDIDRVVELHLAGFEDKQTYLLDAHNNRVDQNVWALYEKFLQRKIEVPTLIEWDHAIPAFDILYAEAMQAAGIKSRVLSNHAHAVA